MNFTQIVGRLLGQENVQSIDNAQLSFGAPWAARSPVWLIFGGVLLAILAGVFYARYQPRGGRVARAVLGACRAALLILLLVILADPILTIRTTSTPRPLLWVLLDGTESMDIRDELSEEQRVQLAEATGFEQTAPAVSADPTVPAPASIGVKPTRSEYVQSLLRKKDKNLLDRLQEKFRVQAFVLDNPDRVRQVAASEAEETKIDAEVIAGEIENPGGQVTALGKALQDLAARHATHNLAGLVVFSDFGQNTGPAPVGTNSAPVNRLGVPIYTVGVGPETAVNLAVDLQVRPVMKKAETSSIDVSLRQTGLEGTSARIVLTAQRLDAEAAASEPILVEERDVTLTAATLEEKFSYTPEATGQFRFAARVDPLPEEVVEQDNTAGRVVDIRDDFLRVMFVEYEPTWEWRFIKEVFHRDKLVGMRGFRTYLSSADRTVRKSNELFLPNLTPDRKDFFANDVIFIGDMPAGALNDRFCNMAKEFVTKFGGGLVVMAGPRFGVGQLADTPLADILPVQVDYGARIRDDRPFELQLTPMAFQQDFMQLGSKDAERAEISQHWTNLGPLPWYQPVRAPHLYGTTVLAEHPVDRCADGSPQPLIAIREFERGSVVYVGFNETWRLRRKHGEEYYRQFWGQMLHRLGLRRAMGAQKRFEVRTDQEQYKPDDKVLVTVVAYDENFEELGDEKLDDRKLSGELLLPGREGEEATQSVSIPLLREGVFEARVPVFAAGKYRLRVKDPVTDETVEHDFEVANVSVERRSATRNVALEQQIAAAHPGGRNYDLTTVERLPDEIQLNPKTETQTKIFPLWSTWLCFALVVLLMLGEWLARKTMNLA